MVGYVLASDVVIIGNLLPSTSTTTGASGAAIPTATAIPSVQQQYENERARRSGAMRRVVQGGLLIGASLGVKGMLFQAGDSTEYEDEEAYQQALDRQENVETGGNVGLALGAALAVYGVAQYALGWRNMSSLEADLPQTADPSMEVQYAEAMAGRGSGRKKFAWGAVLIGASYAALEWAPGLGVPEPEDYDNAADYLDAVDTRDKAETARTWITRGGAVLGAWGLTQWIMSSMKMSEIEGTARMSSAATPSLLPSFRGKSSRLAASPFVDRVRGRTEFGLRWTW